MSDWIWPSSEEINDFPDPLGFEDEWREWTADMSDDAPPVAAEIFAREHLQNSWDSIQDKLTSLEEKGIDPPDNHGVSYRFLRLEGDDAARFANRFGLSQHAERFAAMTEKHRRQNRLSESRIAEGDLGSIEILVASETCGQGMGGPWNTKGRAGIVSRLKSALMQTRSEKVSEASGGSWGHGKKAIANASGCRTIAVYTCSDSDEDPNDDVSTRFLGVSYWKYHDIGEWAHVGLGLLGNGDDYEHGKFATTFLPLEDDSADAFVKDLNLDEVEIRSPEDPVDCGSTYIIVEPCFGPEDLVSALERNWWPLLERNPTTVSVIDYEGNDLEISPRERKELQPFLLANDIAAGDEPQRERGDAVHSLSVDEKPVGTLSLTSDDGDGGWSYARPEDNRTLVALIRNDMVIAYEHFPLRRRRKGPFLRGILYVDREENMNASEMLKMAEPHLHNVWKMESGPSIPKDAAEFAKAVLERIGQHVRDLRKALKDDDETVATHFPVFSDIFSEGREPSRSGGGGGGGGGSPRPFHIRRVELKPLSADPDDPTMVRFESTFEFSLTERQLRRSERLEVFVNPGWLVLEERGAVRDDTLLVEESIEAPDDFEGENGGFRGWLTGDPVNFKWQSRHFPDDWRVAPDPKVSEREDS